MTKKEETKKDKLLDKVKEQDTNKKILAVITQEKQPLTINEIADKTEEDRNYIKTAISRKKYGLLDRKLLAKTGKKGREILYNVTQEGRRSIKEQAKKIHNIKQEIEKELKKEQEYENRIEPIIDKIKNFLQDVLEDQIIGAKGQSIELPFMIIAKYDTWLADTLLDHPKDWIDIFESITESLYDKKITPRIIKLPKTQQKSISDITVKEEEQLISIKGLVKRRSASHPRVKRAKFECRSCANIHKMVYDLDDYFRKPKTCLCKTNVRFKLLKQEYMDFMSVVIEESVDNLSYNTEPSKLNCALTHELARKPYTNKLLLGGRVRINGILHIRQYNQKNRKTGIKKEYFLEAMSIELLEDDVMELNITKDDISEMSKISAKINDDFDEGFSYLARSFAPTIKGHEKIKEAIICQLVTPDNRRLKDGTLARNNIHLLLLGDPGTAKSSLGRFVNKIMPRSRFTSGTTSSGVGLTVSAVQDNFSGGWAADAGAMVLANGSIVILDEMDKLPKEDKEKLHEALSDQTVSLNKAGLNYKLQANTSVLACANPTYGRLDPKMQIYDQIGLSPSMINRFDLIFILYDSEDQKKDQIIANAMFDKFDQKNTKGFSDKDIIDVDIIRKFILQMRKQKPLPFDKESKTFVKQYYVNLRKTAQKNSEKTVPINARSLECVYRLAQSYARLRMGHYVRKIDFQRAFEMLHYSLQQVGLDPETGRVDVAYLSSGVTANQREGITKFIGVLRSLFQDKDILEYENVIQMLSPEFGEGNIGTYLDKLKKEGIIFSPKNGHFKLLQ